MSLDLLLEAALYVEQQAHRGEEPSGEPEQPLAEVSHHPRQQHVNAKLNGSNGHGLEHPQAASVIQRLVPTPSNGSALVSSTSTNAAAFYSHRKERSSRSPSPARGGHCNGGGASRSPPGMPVNGSLSQRSFQSSPKMPDGAEYYAAASSSAYRVDDLASRSHRLEEALLRASRKSPLSLQPGSQYVPGGSGSTSGRTSADELSELKKRSGAGTREVHNKLEKNRRAHLRECFEFLRKQLPAVDDKKLSNLGILKSALRFIQTLKRKEREYEHTMERLAREKIAAQQRLATLRKEVSSLPGYTGTTGLEGMSASDVEQMDLEMDLDEADGDAAGSPVGHGGVAAPSRSLTMANVVAHAQREEDLMYAGQGARGRSREADAESNSGTSTASERGDYVSDEDAGPAGSGPSAFPPESYSHARQPIHVVRPVAQLQQPLQVNGRLSSPVPADGHEPQQQPTRPYNIKYVRAAATVPTTSTITTLAAQQQPTTYLTVVPSADNGVTGGATQLYQVQHHQPSAIAFAGQHQILAAHHGVQLLAAAHPGHGPSTTLKVLTAAGPAGGAAVRVIAADSISTSLQSLVAVSAAGKVGEESGIPTSTGFCIPAGVVIPSLVALPSTCEAGPIPSTSGSAGVVGNGGGSGVVVSSGGVYERSTASPHFKASSSSSSSPTVLSLPNGVLKATVSRSLQQSSTTTAGGATHVVTPITVTRSLPGHLVTNMAVVGQPAHILTSSSLGKVGLLKSGSFPIIGSQYLTTAAAAAGRQVIKPTMMVVAAPPPPPPPPPPSSSAATSLTSISQRGGEVAAPTSISPPTGAPSGPSTPPA